MLQLANKWSRVKTTVRNTINTVFLCKPENGWTGEGIASLLGKKSTTISIHTKAGYCWLKLVWCLYIWSTSMAILDAYQNLTAFSTENGSRFPSLSMASMPVMLVISYADISWFCNHDCGILCKLIIYLKRTFDKTYSSLTPGNQQCSKCQSSFWTFLNTATMAQCILPLSVRHPSVWAVVWVVSQQCVNWEQERGAG